VKLSEFQRFLQEEQGETSVDAVSDDGKKKQLKVAQRIIGYLQDSSRNVQDPHFTVSEFMDYLFSKENQVRKLFTLQSNFICSCSWLNYPLSMCYE
jgi:phosphatidylinositol phospholipase C gamma-1